MRESTYIYKCDWKLNEKKCDMTSAPGSDYYYTPTGWSSFQVKQADTQLGPFHFCVHHTTIMLEEIFSELVPGHPAFKKSADVPT